MLQGLTRSKRLVHRPLACAGSTLKIASRCPLPSFQCRYLSSLKTSCHYNVTKRSGLVRFPVGIQVRWLNIHEYQSVELMKKFNVAVPAGFVASTPAEAEQAAQKLEGPDYVIKAQILAGGRGKGKFLNGFEGGVHVANSILEARGLAAKMLGQRLVTKQTGPDGKPVNKVLIAERSYLRRETYFAILMDRESGGPVLVASPKGGMDIEAVAASAPELIFKEAVNITVGTRDDQLERLAKRVGFSQPAIIDQAKTVMRNLYSLFLSCDCTLVEVNPMAETHNGKVVCMDAKLNFDDNAEFRQQDIFKLRDASQEDLREVQAEKHGLNYIGLDGNIGCLVNGAGLAMATMDSIKLSGGNPANFLDLGGGANVNQVTEAFKLLNGDKQVRAILVNIFGGIMRCDVIALGLIKAATALGLKKPLVVRLAGTNVNEARKLIDESGLRMLTADDLGEAAQKVVRIVEIINMAEQAQVNVSFELPI